MYFPEVIIYWYSKKYSVLNSPVSQYVTGILPENMPKLVSHNGNFKALQVIWFYRCVLLFFQYMTPTLFSLRWHSNASVMASHKCCSSGSNSHSVSCVDMQLHEGWKAKWHATVTGKTFVSSLSFGVPGLQQGNVTLLENHALWLINYCINVLWACVRHLRVIEHTKTSWMYFSKSDSW